MPIYSFECTNEKCSYVFEKICKAEERDNILCPECNSNAILIPSTCSGKVNGFSAENGYHRETINYDGSNRGW